MFQVINMFGLLRQEVEKYVEEKGLYFDGVIIEVKEKHYETYVSVDVSNDKENLFHEIIEGISSTFEKNVYGYNEQNVYTCAFNLLKQRGKKLAIAESVTAGRLCSEFVGNNEGASSVLLEGIVCYSVKSKCARFGIEPSFFEQNSPQSAETSKTLAYGLLRYSGADITIATTGYASSTNQDANNGEAFVAIGLNTGTYTQRVRFFGTRNHIMQQIAKFAFAFLIKLLTKSN